MHHIPHALDKLTKYSPSQNTSSVGLLDIAGTVEADGVQHELYSVQSATQLQVILDYHAQVLDVGCEIKKSFSQITCYLVSVRLCKQYCLGFIGSIVVLIQFSIVLQSRWVWIDSRGVRYCDYY